MIKAEPRREHEWLGALLGEWTSESEMGSTSEETPIVTAVEKVRSLGSLWIVAEAEGKFPDGSTGHWLTTLGYDPQRKRFVGTWVGSMMTHMWVYEGKLDRARKVLTLDTEGPDMSGKGGTRQYQDIIELDSANRRTHRSRMLGKDGEWVELMKATYRRKSRRKARRST